MHLADDLSRKMDKDFERLKKKKGGWKVNLEPVIGWNSKDFFFLAFIASAVSWLWLHIFCTDMRLNNKSLIYRSIIKVYFPKFQMILLIRTKIITNQGIYQWTHNTKYHHKEVLTSLIVPWCGFKGLIRYSATVLYGYLSTFKDQFAAITSVATSC